jgi:aminoglycoside 6-adenylyltransferase
VRTDEEIKNLILSFAEKDDRIRAVLLNGSRANAKALKDKFRDFDIIYIVTDIDSFISDHSWIDYFGERLILQMPEEMTIGVKDEHAFHYLMLFEDHHRIDLAVVAVEKLNVFKPECLTIPLLDKDRLFADLPPSNDADYIVKRPDPMDFSDCCNEFWWVSTYVAKGIRRRQIMYAKHHMETTVRPMFLKMLEWYVGVQTIFSVSPGEHGKNIERYISSDLYEKILATYPDALPENIWKSLFIMTEIFSKLAALVAKAFNFYYNKNEEVNVIRYLKAVHADDNPQ